MLDNPYQVLGLSYDASESEIKKSYYKAALKYHPDRQANNKENKDEDANEKFAVIKEAYEILTDPVKRYDWRQAHGGNGNRTTAPPTSTPKAAPATRASKASKTPASPFRDRGRAGVPLSNTSYQSNTQPVSNSSKRTRRSPMSRHQHQQQTPQSPLSTDANSNRKKYMPQRQQQLPQPPLSAPSTHRKSPQHGLNDRVGVPLSKKSVLMATTPKSSVLRQSVRSKSPRPAPRSGKYDMAAPPLYHDNMSATSKQKKVRQPPRMSSLDLNHGRKKHRLSPMRKGDSFDHGASRPFHNKTRINKTRMARVNMTGIEILQ
ncbi:unnamed protein product [Cylindrotheca closterium]|uniref:J domain-containing protein n=1 Tax=Cylindrotheca closterium TaxID=2856 RepID=A0AAD2CH20_9STRA|nr:unnamed protein product [Cylindrotheca closterium]